MSKAEKPVCATCGSEDVLSDAWASWDVGKQEWVLHNTFDTKYCEQCEGECSVDWVEVGE